MQGPILFAAGLNCTLRAGGTALVNGRPMPGTFYLVLILLRMADQSSAVRRNYI